MPVLLAPGRFVTASVLYVRLSLPSGRSKAPTWLCTEADVFCKQGSLTASPIAGIVAAIQGYLCS